MDSEYRPPDSESNDFDLSMFGDPFNFQDGTSVPALSGMWPSTDIRVVRASDEYNDPDTTPIPTSNSDIPELQPDPSPLNGSGLPVPSSSHSASLTAVEVDDQRFRVNRADSDGSDDSDDSDDVESGRNNRAPSVEQSELFLETLMEQAFEWFLIRVDAIALFTYFLCAINCAPGTATSTHVTRSIDQAIGLVRRMQPDPKRWIPEKVSIMIEGKRCYTTLSDRAFRKAFRLEVSIMKDTLFKTAYESTRKLLAPTYQPLPQFEYPRIVLLRSLDDIATASNWSTHPKNGGRLVWHDREGFLLFHIYTLESDGSLAVVWFGRPEIREFLYHFFRQSRSIGFVEAYQLARNDIGRDLWGEITHATDPMLAFGLGWIAAVVESDVLRNNRFEGEVITRRRCLHFLGIYRKIIAWLRSLRNGSPIAGLSAESRAQAVQAIDMLSDLSLPDISLYR